MFVIHKGMTVRGAILCPTFCMYDVASKAGLCAKYQTHHWQKVTDMAVTWELKYEAKIYLFCLNNDRTIIFITAFPGADILSSQHPLAELSDSRAAVGWHTLHGVPLCGPCPHWSGGGGKRHTQTWRSRLQCWSRCCVTTICRKISLLLISAQVLGYIDMGIGDSAKGCGVQVHRQWQLCPWK